MNMTAHKPPIPGLLWGAYPERNNTPDGNHYLTYVPFWGVLEGLFVKHKAAKVIAKVHKQQAMAPAFNTLEYQQALVQLQANLNKDGFTDTHVVQAFTLIHEAMREVMDIALYDTQLMAAYYMVNGCLAEMATGEGKTYAVALAAATAALSGIPVHVVTANDYLAGRDENTLKKFYNALNLIVSSINNDQDTTSRQLSYRANITYCTAKELVFDYLKDKSQHQHQDSQETSASTLLSGLCMAIIDEADSILIDEANVPFVLSAAENTRERQEHYQQTMRIANQLTRDVDFRVNVELQQAQLTTSGQQKLNGLTIGLPPVWHNQLHREASITTALSALYTYHRDQHYLVKDNQVSMIDTITGRIAKGRAWSGGLQQLIELKENCALSDKLATVAQITYQRFFPKYIKLAGISGTLTETSHELKKHYDLTVCKIPLRIPSQAKMLPMQLFKSTASRNTALIRYIKQLHQSGRPILVATESVKASEVLSDAMQTNQVKHHVLNAKQDAQEAQRISQAGQKHAITVTTNMAGRGTDIKVDDAVNDLGGLHVISCQVNASQRLDRQLIGRAARHGQHGSAEIWVSLESKKVTQWLPNFLIKVLKRYDRNTPHAIIWLLMRYVQRMEAQSLKEDRVRLMKSDQAIEKHLTFGGLYD